MIEDEHVITTKDEQWNVIRVQPSSLMHEGKVHNMRFENTHSHLNIKTCNIFQ